MHKGLDALAQRVLARDPRKKSEMQRICSVPIVRPLSSEESALIGQEETKADALAQGFRLTEGQVEALHAFRLYRGVFAPLPVGTGKTLISLKCAAIAAEWGVERSAIFVPPQVHTQLVQRDIQWVRTRTPLGVTFYPLGGKSRKQRAMLSQGRRKGCWIIPYSLLSAADAHEVLYGISPQLLVFDEAHNLRHRTAARTKRILTYCENYKPMVVCLSGTMTSKSVQDYAHLIALTLGEYSPLPRDASSAYEWAALLDSEPANQYANPVGRRANPGSLRPLVNWSNENFPDNPATFDKQGFRKAYQHRLMSTPGVVSAQGESLGTSLLVENRPVPLMSRGESGAQLQALMDKLELTWTSPNGDELEHAIVVAKCRYELSAGFYNSLYWPEETPENASILFRSKEHHVLRQKYHKELRAWFSSRDHVEGMDTPMLVASSMARHGAKQVTKELYEAWQAMHAADFPERLERLSKPVRVCDYKIHAAVEHMRSAFAADIPTIYWFYHHGIGEWLTEAAAAAGIDHIYAPAGAAANRMLVQELEATKGRPLIASIKAHGTGKNLQSKYIDQYYVQIPQNETMFEQAVGRTHRQGQEADVCTIYTNVSNKMDELCVAAILNDAAYVYESMRLDRKSFTATWNPPPTVHASAVLTAAGLTAKSLSARQQLLLSQRFSTTPN